MAKAKYWNEAVCKWGQSLTTMWGAVLYLFTGLCGSFLLYLNTGAITSADFGLILLYASILQRAMMDYCMGLTQLETNFVSVERCAEYSRLPKEVVPTFSLADGDDDGSKTQAASSSSSAVAVASSSSGASSSSSSPSGKTVQIRGSVDMLRKQSKGENPHDDLANHLEVWDLSMRYRIHKKLVLHRVNFNIIRGEKVAIVGRTGSGKSSLYNALTGLYPTLNGNCVRIDGENLQDYYLKNELHAWRHKKFRVVSQDSALMSGTMRENLGKQYTDAKMWNTLEKVGL